ncbi:RNA polymerase sigma factor [Labrys sp. KB_33_2]|uniref:RNA polymerase sigma factor n=1 Tax=Labrys sp. KB_33_2 TaxID=3237479 RepID=UPI003F8DE05A
MPSAPAVELAEIVARRSYGRLVALLAARSGDIAGAEDALADAFAAALEHWPAGSVPANPEAWLLTAARRRQIDAARRAKLRGEKADEVIRHVEALASEQAEQPVIPDERLRLMFACAHPSLDAAVRAPLILQTILGFDAGAIASAFLVSPAAMSQRLVRAKLKIKQAAIPFRIPEPDELPGRLEAVLEAVYAVYAEGWADPEGAQARERNLSVEGIWLGRLLVSLLPGEPEVLGLLALMLHAEARRAARRSPVGDYIPLEQQDTTLWDAALIEEAEALLARAGQARQIGRYQLEAALQSAHANRRICATTDWAAIVTLYEALVLLTASPVAAINRAVALARLAGPQAGLAGLDEVASDRRIADYQPYWAARADLLARAARQEEARNAYSRAIGLESDPVIRRYLQGRLAALG